MNTISLLDVFRTGKFGSVELGMTKTDVTTHLGGPDDWYEINLDDRSQPYSLADSPIWIYAGVEFYWQGENGTLSDISFKPFYLYGRKWETRLDRWIFRRRQGPSLKRLKSALEQEAIPFQDTGLELYMAQLGAGYVVIPLKDAPTDYDSDDVFGTLVLKSGVQVRYLEDDCIERVALGSPWLIKGSERFIQW